MSALIWTPYDHRSYVHVQPMLLHPVKSVISLLTKCKTNADAYFRAMQLQNVCFMQTLSMCEYRFQR